MQVDLLGPLRVTRSDGVGVEVGGARSRALVAVLALAAGRVVSVGGLVDGVWGVGTPSGGAGALQSLVSRLRRALGPDAGAIESQAAGYRLVAGVDVVVFEDLARRGREALRGGAPGEADARLREALALWRGPALAGVDAPFVEGAAARLADLRWDVVEDRADADIRLGRPEDAVGGLRAITEAAPARERAAALLVRALYLSGRQADALAEYERVRRALDEELGVEPSVELREAHLAVLRGEVERPRPAARPAALTSFIGRRAELQAVRERFGRGRLATLVGPGGAGKTRLAAEVVAGHELPSWFVELAGVRAAEDVITAVAAAVGARERRVMEGTANAPAPVSDPVDRVVQVLSARPSVLVLDNCEHLIDAAAGLADLLLARCPDLRVLATSREPLAITGEAVLPVGPLELPGRADGPEAVAGAEAVRLFVDRAAAVSPGFTVGADNAADVVEICRRLDGLPLALELAAARLRSMTVRQVADRLDDRFRLLTGGSRTSLPRHRTLRAVVEWSWDLLEKPERLVATRLSVFPAGATADAVADVAGGDEVQRDDVLYVLSSLVEKSLVRVGEGPDGVARYRMLETIRAYAAERLAADGDADAVRSRFTAHFLAFIEDAEPRLFGAGQLTWFARIRSDQDNLAAALRHAVDSGDAGTATRIAVRATWFWMLSGQHKEAVAAAERVLAVPGPAAAHARAALRALLAFGDPGASPDREVAAEVGAELARTRAAEHYPGMVMLEPMMAAFNGAVDRAFALLDRYEALPDPWARAVSYVCRAFLLENMGEAERAERYAERGFAAFRLLGDRWGQAMAASQVGEHRSRRGDHAGAIEAGAEAMRLIGELGAVDELPGMLGRLALQRARGGDLDAALRDMRDALRLARERGTQEAEVLVAVWLASVHRWSGDLAAAVDQLAESRALAERLGRASPHWWVNLWAHEAAVAIETGDHGAARDRLRQALDRIMEIPDYPIAATVGEMTAQLVAAEGRPDEAARLLGASTALRGCPDLGDPDTVALLSRLDATLGADARAKAADAAKGEGREAGVDRVRAALSDP